jgi:hypothetical protein
MMKRLLFPVLAFSVIILFSCNNDEDKKEAGPDVIPSASFKVILLRHPVRDFAHWKSEYMSHDSMRQLYGVHHFLYGRSLEDSNMVIVIDKITEGEKAKNFSHLPELKMDMLKAGVTGPPSIGFADIVRNDDSKIEEKDRVMIIHKVKDFNTWLKVYDGEGMNARKKYGLIDRGLGRDMDDPNKVYIVFAISDMKKAKARIASADLKKIMTDAGVEGPPDVFYYRLVD